MPSYAVLHTQKLKSRSDVMLLGRHNRREQATLREHLLHRDADHAPVNLLGTDNQRPEERLDVALAGVKVRKNAVYAVSILISASPDYFRPSEPDASGTYDPERLATWVKVNKAWMLDKWGEDRILEMSLHTDEVTPHIHCVVVPLTDNRKRLAAATFFDGPKLMREWQDDAAAAVKHLDISRGIECSPVAHKDTAAYYADQRRAEAPQIITPAPEPVPELGFADKLSSSKRDAHAVQLRAAAEQQAEHDRQIQARLDAIPALEAQAAKYQTLRREICGKKVEGALNITTATRYRKALTDIERLRKTPDKSTTDLTRGMDLPHAAMVLSALSSDAAWIANVLAKQLTDQARAMVKTAQGPELLRQKACRTEFDKERSIATIKARVALKSVERERKLIERESRKAVRDLMRQQNLLQKRIQQASCNVVNPIIIPQQESVPTPTPETTTEYTRMGM